jgi:beta-barrel assembly-enhancing protease
LVVAVGTATSEQGRSGFAIAALVNHMLQLRYGRSDELESDNWGLRLLKDAKYNPEAMIKVMQVLKAASKNMGALDIFQTHPNPDQRIADIKAHLEKNPPDALASNGHQLQELFNNPSLIEGMHR